MTDGYYVGSPELDEPTHIHPDIPYVTFWGEETEPVSGIPWYICSGETVSLRYMALESKNDPYLTEQANLYAELLSGKSIMSKNNKVNWDEFWDLYYFLKMMRQQLMLEVAVYRMGMIGLPRQIKTWKGSLSVQQNCVRQ